MIVIHCDRVLCDEIAVYEVEYVDEYGDIQVAFCCENHPVGYRAHKITYIGDETCV